MESDCKDCKYYDPDNDNCKAFDCWPVKDCDEPLPCEEGEISQAKRKKKKK